MESNQYLVSARKYRPQTFDIVVGQSTITTTLKNAVKSGHLAHSYLFCGPRGVGKTTCARIFAKTINCDNLQANQEPCNQCEPCKAFNSGATFNIFELDAASNNSVEDIRHLIEQVRYAPTGGKYKVFIIDEVHMLSSGAFNAFLKTLEEPPSYVIFILATTEKHKILPTIISRCQVFEFKRIEVKDSIAYLKNVAQKENIKIDEDTLHIIAQKSDGGMRDALSLFDKLASFTNNDITYKDALEHLNILDDNLFFNLFEHFKKQEVAAVLNIFEDIYLKGFEGDLFLNSMSEFLRNLLVCKTPESIALLNVIESYKEKYIDLSKQINLSFVLSGLNILNEAEINFKITRNKKLLVETALIKLTYLDNALELIEGEGEQIASKKKIAYNSVITYKNIYRKRRSGIVEQGEKNVSVAIPPVTPKNLNTDTTLSASQIEIKLESTTNVVAQPLSAISPISPVSKSVLSNINNSLISSGGRIVKIESIKQSVSQQVQKPKKNLTPTDLTNMINAYIEMLRKNNTATTTIDVYEKAKFSVQNETDISIEVFNNFFKSAINNDSVSFLNFLNRYFQRNDLKINIILKENEQSEDDRNKYLNAHELYEKLIEFNPHIKKLKDTLGLDILP